MLYYMLHKSVNRAYRVDALNERSCRCWFPRLKSRNFSQKKSQVKVFQKHSKDLEAAVTENPDTTATELNEKCTRIAKGSKRFRKMTLKQPASRKSPTTFR